MADRLSRGVHAEALLYLAVELLLRVDAYLAAVCDTRRAVVLAARGVRAVRRAWRRQVCRVRRARGVTVPAALVRQTRPRSPFSSSSCSSS